jgi:hypothetical protein
MRLPEESDHGAFVLPVTPRLRTTAVRCTGQRGDPAPSVLFFDLVNLWLRQHPAITNQDHAGQPERLPQLLDLIDDGFLVVGISRINIYGDGAPGDIRDHPIDNDRQSFLSIAIMTKAYQRAGATFIIAAAHVIENQTVVGEMAFGQFCLDAQFAFQQPVQGFVEIVFRSIRNAQLLGQGGAVPVSGRGYFRTGMKQAFDDHRYDEIPLSATLRGKDGVETYVSDRLEDRLDVAVGNGFLCLQDVVGRNQRLIPQEA